MSIVDSVSQKITAAIIYLINNRFNRNQRILILKEISHDEDQLIEIATKHGMIQFFCPNSLLEWRAYTLLDKEPETLDWIDSFDLNGIFWDIGANIGCYSLYAGKRGIRTYAFEPQCANYYILNRNILTNSLGKKISAFCLALSKEQFLGSLYISELVPGGALNCFGEPVDQYDSCGKHLTVQYKQGMIGFSIDDLITQNNLEIPNYVKIDVDGIEKDILLGAKKTLQNPALRSVLVELDESEEEESRFVTRYLRDCGLVLKEKRHAEIFNEGPWKTVFNCIFARE
jgi:FkbM family methyltransferase